MFPNDYFGEYVSAGYRYVHTWPGKPKQKNTGKHRKARKSRFHAKNA